MEIIKQGKLPEDRMWQGECFTCNTMAKAKQSELKVTYEQRDGPIGTHACPVCNKTMHFYPIESRNNLYGH
jgi:hypothetical protein